MKQRQASAMPVHTCPQKPRAVTRGDTSWLWFGKAVALLAGDTETQAWQVKERDRTVRGSLGPRQPGF